MSLLLLLTGSGAAPAVAQTYVYARAAIARSGATRANYYRPINAHVTINGVDRRHYMEPSSIEIVDIEDQQVNTCTLRVFGFTPTIGHEIVIGLGDASDNRLFAGRILRYTAIVGHRHDARVFYDLECVDYTWDLDRKRIFQQFAGQSATTLVQHILELYCTDITTDHVEGDLAAVDDMFFTGAKVTEALDEIANRIGARWYVDYFNDLHFYTTEALDGDPEEVHSVSRFEWRNLRYTPDMSQVRTRVYSEGSGARLIATMTGTGLGAPAYNAYGLYTVGSASNQAHIFTDAEVQGDGTADRIRIDQSLYIPVAYYAQAQVATVTSPASVGATTIDISSSASLSHTSTYGGRVIINGQVIAYTGINGAPQLTGVPASGEGSIQAALTTGDDVIRPYTWTVTGTYLGQAHQVGAAVRAVRCRNDTTAQTALAALDGSDGIREDYYQDPQDDYLQAATAGGLLTKFASPLTSISYETRDVNVRSGKSVEVNVGSITGTYRIQKVTLHGLEVDGLKVFPWRAVEAAPERIDVFQWLLQRGRVG